VKPLLLLVRKDLIRRLRSPAATIVMLLFPVFMSLLVGLTFGGGGGGDSTMPAIKVLLVDRDDDFLSGMIRSIGTSDEAEGKLDLVPVEAEEGMELMGQGKASALLEIPEGFTEDVLAGRPASLRVVRNPAEAIYPEIVEQGARAAAVYLTIGGRIFGEPIGRIRDLIGESEDIPTDQAVNLVTSMALDRARLASPYLFPPVITVKGEKGKEEGGSGGGINIFSVVLPMVGVMAIFFISNIVARDLMIEQEDGSLARLRTTSLGLGTILWSKVASAVLVCLGSIAMLGAFGFVVGWFRVAVDPLGLLFHSVALAWACAGLSILIQGLGRTRRQADAMFWVVAMGMAVLGGSMTPVDQLPAFARQLAPWTLNYWGIEGFLRLLVPEAAGSWTGPAAILAGVGLLASRLGVIAVRRRLREAPA
jgi:ABC-2 type transport system permease protein